MAGRTLPAWRHAATYALADGPRPVSLPHPVMGVTKAKRATPVWVRVPTADGGESIKAGFALAWTAEAVRVQVLWPKEYYSAATELWVQANRVSRRRLDSPR